MPIAQLRNGRPYRPTYSSPWPAPRRSPTDAATHRPSPPASSRATAASFTLRASVARRHSGRFRRRNRRTMPGNWPSSRSPPRLEKCSVSSDDLVRRVEQPRRPQVVGQVVACFEFGGKATIADQNGIVGDCERLRNSTICSGTPSQSGNGGDTPGTRWRVHGGCGTHEAICSANTAKYHRRDSALSVAPRRNERVASGDRGGDPQT